MRDPSTVRWFVIPVIVDAVDCQIFSIAMRLRPVSELSEVVTPFFAHRYAAPAVVLIGSVRRCKTPSFDVAPSAIKTSLCFAMGYASRNPHFVVETTARVGSAVTKRIRFHGCAIPAVTLAFPKNSRSLSFDFANYDKSTKTLACDVNFSHSYLCISSLN